MWLNAEAIEKALEMINSIVAEPEMGTIYEGKVVKIMDFGAFVNFFGKRDGLVHISQLSNERVNKVTPKLFQLADNPKDMSSKSPEEIYKIIKPCGLSPSKSKAIQRK